MKRFSCTVFFLIQVFSMSAARAQDDEVRQGLGLPSKIGENSAQGTYMNVSGRITLDGADKSGRRPIITVLVNYAGTTAEKTTANDTGYFIAKNVPRQNVTLVIEVDGREVARQLITPSQMGNPRYDFTIPWPTSSALSKPGVTYANQYARTEKNEELFQRAITAAKAKDAVKASETFNLMLTADPKDFVAWTELGSVYFKQNALDNAEACYFKAIQLKSDYFVALLNLGKLYVSRKQSDNAVLVLSNALKSNSGSADAQEFMGEAYLLAQKGTLAVKHLNEAIRLEPTDRAEIHLRLAMLYDAAKMKDKAAAEYKLFLVKRPEYAKKAQLEKYISDNK